MNKNIIITILTVIILGLGGYLVFNVQKDENANGEVNNNLTQEKNFDIAEAKKLVGKYYSESPTSHINTFKTGYTEEIKKYVALKNSEYDKMHKEWREDFGAHQDAIKYDALNETYKRLFGEANNATKEDFNLGCSGFTYNINSDSFVDVSECGGVFFPLYFYEVKAAKQKDNELVIDVVYAEFEVVGTNEDEEITYPVYNDILNNRYNYKDIYGIEEGKQNYNKFKKEYLEKNSDKLPVYTFTFELENNHYVFKSLVKN